MACSGVGKKQSIYRSFSLPDDRVLFTFPSRYYTLAVAMEYLGLDDGPPLFGETFPDSLLLKDNGTSDETGLAPF